MKTFLPYKRVSLLILAVMLAMVAGACAPSRIGVSWPATDNVVIDGKPYVVVAYNFNLTLLNPETGQVAPLLDAEGQVRLDDSGNPRKWDIDGHNYESAEFFTRPHIVVDSNDVQSFLVPAYNSRLLKVDTKTARIDSPAGTTMPSPLIADMAEDDTNYYVPLMNHDVIAVSKSNLETLRTFPTKQGVWAKPLVQDGIIYISAVDHHIYAYDVNTAQPVWDAPANLQGVVSSTPLLLDGALYVGSYASKFFKLDAKTGEILNEYVTQNWVWSTPVVYDGTLYVTDLSGWVHALSPNDLSVVWSRQAADGGIRPSALVTENHVIVASRHGQVFWLDRATGAESIMREIEGKPEILSDLLLVKADEALGITRDLVLVTSLQTGQFVSAFTLDNGQAVWVYRR